MISFENELWKSIDVQLEDDCWNWLGKLDEDGYGIIKSKSNFAHRKVWELVNGPIPIGMSVLHFCDNRPCCNPAHLFLGNHLSNMADMRQKCRGRGPAKLTASQVLEIRTLFESGVSKHQLSAQYHVDRTTIRHIIQRKTWKYV